MPAHLFLASLGKTVLRPGGKKATARLLTDTHISSKTKVLEVATNMGTTAIHIAKTYGAQVVGIDLNKEAVKQANENVNLHNVADLVTITQGNAVKLPFEDNSFDVVLNEAMLTMLPHEMKEKALQEYIRVLKPGGYLATHDLLIKPSPVQVAPQIADLREAIVVKAQPLNESDWTTLFQEQGFSHVLAQVGELHLLSFAGLLRDEGFEGIMKMITNAQKNPNDEAYFMELIEQFDDKREYFGHITVVAQKPQ